MSAPSNHLLTRLNPTHPPPHVDVGDLQTLPPPPPPPPPPPHVRSHRTSATHPPLIQCVALFAHETHPFDAPQRDAADNTNAHPPHSLSHLDFLSATAAPLKGELVVRYPPAPSPTEPPLPDGIEYFAFPNGIWFRTDTPPAVSTVHSFVLTLMTGQRLYGYACTQYHAVSDEVLGLVRMSVADRLMQSATPVKSAMNALPRLLYAPVCLCVLTEYGASHSDWFAHVVNTVGCHRQLTQDTVEIVYTAMQHQTPYNSKPLRVHADHVTPPVAADDDDQTSSLSQVITDCFRTLPLLPSTSASSAPLLSAYSLSLLFSLLEPKLIIAALSALLSEQSTLIVSEDISYVTPCVEALFALLYPFKWPYIYIPLLPLSLTDFFEAPQPFLIGSHLFALDALSKTTAVVIFDLDRNTITLNGVGHTIHVLPAPIEWRLYHLITTHFAVFQLSYPHALQHPPTSLPSNALPIAVIEQEEERDRQRKEKLRSAADDDLPIRRNPSLLTSLDIHQFTKRSLIAFQTCRYICSGSDDEDETYDEDEDDEHQDEQDDAAADDDEEEEVIEFEDAEPVNQRPMVLPVDSDVSSLSRVSSEPSALLQQVVTDEADDVVANSEFSSSSVAALSNSSAATTPSRLRQRSASRVAILVDTVPLIEAAHSPPFDSQSARTIHTPQPMSSSSLQASNSFGEMASGSWLPTFRSSRTSTPQPHSPAPSAVGATPAPSPAVYQVHLAYKLNDDGYIVMANAHVKRLRKGVVGTFVSLLHGYRECVRSIEEAKHVVAQRRRSLLQTSSSLSDNNAIASPSSSTSSASSPTLPTSTSSSSVTFSSPTNRFAAEALHVFDVFDAASFLAQCHSNYQTFLVKFIESQLFKYFLQERIPHIHTHDDEQHRHDMSSPSSVSSSAPYQYHSSPPLDVFDISYASALDRRINQHHFHLERSKSGSLYKFGRKFSIWRERVTELPRHGRTISFFSPNARLLDCEVDYRDLRAKLRLNPKDAAVKSALDRVSNERDRLRNQYERGSLRLDVGCTEVCVPDDRRAKYHTPWTFEIVNHSTNNRVLVCANDAATRDEWIQLIRARVGEYRPHSLTANAAAMNGVAAPINHSYEESRLQQTLRLLRHEQYELFKKTINGALEWQAQQELPPELQTLSTTPHSNSSTNGSPTALSSSASALSIPTTTPAPSPLSSTRPLSSMTSSALKDAELPQALLCAELMLRNLDIRDRVFRYKTYTQSFVAKDAVQWLLTAHLVQHGDDAVRILNKLIDFKIIEAVNKSAPAFKNDDGLYRYVIADALARAQEEDCLSCMTVTETMLPPIATHLPATTTTVHLHAQIATTQTAVSLPTVEERLIVSTMRDELDIRTRSYGIFRTTYPDCVLGRDILAWLLDRGVAHCEADALRLANRLVTSSQIEPAVHNATNAEFKGGMNLYRIKDAQRTNNQTHRNTPEIKRI